jgi:hypothetical protein
MVDFKKLSNKKKTLSRISELVEEYGELNDDISIKEKRQKEIRLELEPLFLSTELEEFVVPSSDPDLPDRVIERTKGRKSLSKEKLLMNGVSLKTIERSYAPGKPGIKIRSLKQDGETDDANEEES